MGAEVSVTPRWRELLEAEIGRSGSKAAVARQLEVSRPYISRVVSGSLTPVPKKFVARVLRQLDTVECPADGRAIPRAGCDLALKPAPTHNPFAMRRWGVCQQCPHKPEEDRS
jgi:hypothetical protein